ncbi:MAG: hypothetical protein CMM96_00760 [Rickettsiales bacterium]|nr:hypothetical protein [Rickettsiales bacterium]|tara:strand:- start:5748 stop:6170 length:423 start_codon:yes stop_codon:yes gene_type:complete
MKKKMILFVCVANYCRSPVAERLFNYKNTSEYYAESAGLIQFKQTSMENRSKKFLEIEGIKTVGHIPKKINLDQINKCSIVYALDFDVLNDLRRKFPENYAKFRILSNDGIADPINENDSKYHFQMVKIRNEIEKIKKML